jgi:hypothetical protein
VKLKSTTKELTYFLAVNKIAYTEKEPYPSFTNIKQDWQLLCVLRLKYSKVQATFASE